MILFPKYINQDSRLQPRPESLNSLTVSWDDHPSDGRQAAVLFLIGMQKDGLSKLVLTKRSNKVSTHKGQIGFAGGHREIDDINPAATALREAHEEIGIHPEQVEVVGELKTFESIHGTTVIPIVATCELDKIDFTLQKSEVDRLILAPLDIFSASNTKTKDYEYKGRIRQTFIYDHKDDRIWGLTAHIIASTKLSL